MLNKVLIAFVFALLYTLPTYSQDDKEKEKQEDSNEELVVESGTVVSATSFVSFIIPLSLYGP